MELDLTAVYTHYKKGNEYVIEQFCKIQVDDVWVEGVIYAQRFIYDQKYVRTLEEFKQKFTKQEEKI